MGSFDRYIFRTTFGAFLLILISLTTVIWLTHALREIDLMTNQRQTVLTFIGITGLLIPMLVLVIAPIALVIAVGHTLNRLNTDSEIVVMNASGMSPWRIFRPFLTTTLVVSVLVLGRQRLSGAEGPARTARLGHQGEGRFRRQHRAARPLHHHRARPHVPYPRAARRRPVARHLHRRPARSERARRPRCPNTARSSKPARGTFLVLMNGSVQRAREPGAPIRPS